MNTSKTASHILLVIVLLLFSYDLTTYFSTSISVAVLKASALAAVVLLYFLYFRILPQTPRINRNAFWKLIFVYLIMLSLRVFYDFVIEGIEFFIYKSAFTVVFMFTNIFILPTWFFYHCKSEFNYYSFAKFLGIILFLCLIVSVRTIMSGNGIMSDTSGRFSANESIDVIYFGHMGVSLFLLGFYILINKFKRLYRLASLLFLGVGVLTMAFSGERGPMVAMLVCSSVLLFVHYSKNGISIPVVVFSVVIILLLPLLFTLFNEYLSSYGITSLDKIVKFVNGESDSAGNDRFLMWALALDLFLENPITGVNYLLPDGSYVHNMYVEQFMALGLIGGLLFMWININAIIVGYRLSKINKKTSIVYVLYFQYMIYGFFSRTLIAIPQYWLMLIVLFYINDYERKRIGVNNNTNL